VARGHGGAFAVELALAYEGWLSDVDPIAVRKYVGRSSPDDRFQTNGCRRSTNIKLTLAGRGQGRGGRVIQNGGLPDPDEDRRPDDHGV